MLEKIGTALTSTALLVAGTGTLAQDAVPGKEEFGLTPKQLVQSIEKVETLIAKCMREQGFQYIAADYLTVRRGMAADKKLPGMSEEEFIDQYGFGISTLYTGKPPQLTTGYSPGRVGLGERNVELFKGLSPADQVAYTRALFGSNPDATFAVGLETENFSRTGGCTRTAIEQVFDPDQLKATYYNPKDALINRDPRMREALRTYSREMRAAGFGYDHPDEVEPDIRERMDSLTAGGSLALDQMSPSQLAALKELQDYEKRVAAKNLELEEELIDPVEERIEKELYARDTQ